MVEFAIVGPVFLLTMFLILEGALYVNAVATIENAAREGARVAALCGTSKTGGTYNGNLYHSCNQAIVQEVYNHAGALRFVPTTPNPVVKACSPPGTCSTTYSGPAQPGDEIEVNVTYTYGYYMQLLVGTPPTTSIVSDVRVVSQQ